MGFMSDSFSSCIGPKEYAQKYLSGLQRTLAGIDTDSIARIVEVLSDTRKSGATIYVAGNGGSAATSSHFVEDLAYGTKGRGNQLFKVIGLTDNVAYISAIGNDEAYELVFTRQIANLWKKGDVLFAITGSGNSKNILQLIEYANSHDGTSIVITGFGGGKASKLAHYCINVPTEYGDYGIVEDSHLVLSHIISTYLTYCILKESCLPIK